MPESSLLNEIVLAFNLQWITQYIWGLLRSLYSAFATCLLDFEKVCDSRNQFQLERFSVECSKTKTKVITPANQKGQAVQWTNQNSNYM